MFSLEREGPGNRKRPVEETKTRTEVQTGQEQKEQVKAVMFVPYTVGSELARKMRQAESALQEMKGFRLKKV